MSTHRVLKTTTRGLNGHRKCTEPISKPNAEGVDYGLYGLNAFPLCRVKNQYEKGSTHEIINMYARMKRHERSVHEMPLIIDAKECVDHDPDLMYPMASFMMITGVSSLPDQKAADEFYTRYLMYCLLFDVKEGDQRMTHAQVSAYIGCWANVSTYTPTQYAKTVARWAREESVKIMQHELRANEKENTK